MDTVFNDFLSLRRHLSQDRFIFSQSTQTLYGGGVGSGKSRALIERALFLSCFLPGNIGLIGRYTFTELESTTKLQFFEEIGEAGLDDLIIDIKKTEDKVILRTHEPGNRKPKPSTIIFRHVYDPRPDKKHLASLNLGWFGGDQIEDWEEHIWNDLQGRLRHKRVEKAFSFGVYNPKGHGWWWRQFKLPAMQAGRLNQDSYVEQEDPHTGRIVKVPALLDLEHPDAIHPNAVGFRIDQVPGLSDKPVEVGAYRAGREKVCFCTVTEENTTLRPNYIQNLRDNNPAEWVARMVDGSDESMQGRIYKEFKGITSVHCLKAFPIPEHWQAIISIDPGGDVPWAINTYRFDPIEGDCIVTNELYSTTVLLNDIADWIKNPQHSGVPKWDGLNVTIISDPDVRIIQEMADKHDITLQRAKKTDKNSGIFLVAGYFHRRPKRIKVFPGQDYKHELSQQRGDVVIHDAPYLWVFAENCPNWVREHEEWEWDKNVRTFESKEKPVDRNDHCCDNALYALRERPPLAEIIKDDPRMAELRKQDFMAYLDARSIRRAMDEHSDSWTPPKGEPCGDAFRDETGGMEDSLVDSGKIEW